MADDRLKLVRIGASQLKIRENAERRAQERIKHAKKFIDGVKQVKSKVASFNTNYRKPHFQMPSKAPEKAQTKPVTTKAVSKATTGSSEQIKKPFLKKSSTTVKVVNKPNKSV